MPSPQQVSDPGLRAVENSAGPAMPSVRLFDLDIAAVSFGQAVEALSQAAVRRDGRARIVVTPNVDHVVRLDAAPDFRARYAQADFIFADGMPVVWASRLLGQPLPERITGSDLFVALCRRAQRDGWRVMLLGGMPGSEPALHERFAQYFPGLDIEVVSPSMRFDPVGPEGQAFADRVRERKPDVVFLCVGMPKQENWALHHAPALPGGILLCVGAAMEFAIGLQRRAPMWMQRAGLEWLWRLASNPRRLWRRYLVDDPRFAVLCWRQWRKRRGSAP
ncbi:WecB/TagA/CpsF family glycosyltransferase [Bordetella hinzii]|nr:WecB/TagA/CpsF family glycosyltransferase [Bordetella hinzii]AKQ54979.1 Putative N-acetylmannosaminyltransferase [Bordetella hinzii]AKQ59490.1 Putative N-acetylmannosaminyltransferase [Bordetella hinzii]WPL80048.1 WecB/TagA/CpsF family glycosyltransferase [Bordetella hinzii]SNV93357.1 capsular polysaccharide biosynthesis glucosyltransferase [Bordetella hinzii]VEH23387.1 capsular polysaccharide biosynthesis glucosyltransferase [Bordetella hinzii]